MALDVVCNMEVDEASTEWTSEYQGKTYYFCAPGCKRTFDENQEKFLQGSDEHTSHEGHAHH